VLNDLDPDKRRLGYFHNAGYYSLEGEDFARTLRLEHAAGSDFHAVFAELVRIDALVRRPATELVALSRSLWRRHLKRARRATPCAASRGASSRTCPGIQERGLPTTTPGRSARSASSARRLELAAANLKWLASEGVAGLTPATLAFEQLSAANKTFILKGARATNSRRPLDSAALFDEMAGAWERGMQTLESVV